MDKLRDPLAIQLTAQEKNNALIRDDLRVGRLWVPCVAALLFMEGVFHLGDDNHLRVGLTWLASAITAALAWAYWKRPRSLVPYPFWSLLAWALPLAVVLGHISLTPMPTLVFSTLVLMLLGCVMLPLPAIAIAIPVTGALQITSAMSVQQDIPGALLAPLFSIPLALFIHLGRRRGVLEREQKKQLAIELQQEQSKLDRMGAFVKVAQEISHHINNKLTAVVAGTSTALETLEPDHPSHRWLQMANESAINVAEMSTKLLGFAGNTMHYTQPVSVISLLNEEPLRAAVPAEVKLHIDIEDGLPALSGNEEQLREVLVTLVSNAAESMAGKGDIHIKAARKASDSDTKITVRDSGEGIEPQFRDRVLEPFFTTRGPDRSGLGLSFATGTMHQHGGKLEVVSSPGEGTTVTLSFPAPVS